MRKLIIAISQMRRLRKWDYMWLQMIPRLKKTLKHLSVVSSQGHPSFGLCRRLARSRTAGQQQPCPNARLAHVSPATARRAANTSAKRKKHLFHQ